MSGPKFILVTDGFPDDPLCFTCSWCPVDAQGSPVKVLGTDLGSHSEWVHLSSTFSVHTSSRRLRGEPVSTDYWDDGYWGPVQLYRGRPELVDLGSIFYVKVPLPGSMVTIVTTSGEYARLLTEMLANCGVKLESVDTP